MTTRYAIALLTLMLCDNSNLTAQEFQPKASEITSELQKLSQSNNKLRLVWWITDEFWIASLKEGKSLTDKAITDFIKPLSDYNIIAVVDASVSGIGAFSYPQEEAIRKLTYIFDATNQMYSPIDHSELSGDVKNLLEMMKPMLSNAMGQLGQNMHFLVFKRKTKSNTDIVNPRSNGRFRIQLSGEDFFFRLPVAALSEKVICKEDSELFPSNFKFCPYHGAPLTKQPSNR